VATASAEARRDRTGSDRPLSRPAPSPSSLPGTRCPCPAARRDRPAPAIPRTTAAPWSGRPLRNTSGTRRGLLSVSRDAESSERSAGTSVLRSEDFASRLTCYIRRGDAAQLIEHPADVGRAHERFADQ